MRVDDNCFSRTVSHVITDDQEEQAYVRLSTVHYMHQNAEVVTDVPTVSETMEQYLHESNMETIHIWATEVVVFATAKLLNTPIWVFSVLVTGEAIYIVNRSLHFEPAFAM